MRISICCFILMQCLTLSGQKRLKFEFLDQMPRSIVGFGYALDKDNLYAIGGSTFNKPRISSVQIYDNKMNKWLDFKLKNLPKHRYSSAVYVEDYKGVVLAGGVRLRGNSEVLIDTIRIIYPDKMNIELLGTLPEPAKKIGMAHDKNIVYLFGGSKSRGVSVNGPIHYTFSNKFYAYDMTNGFVYELPDLPIAMETAGGIVDGKLYVFGGFSGRPLSSIYQYDIDKKTWKELGKLDSPISANALTQFENYFILVGDHHDMRQLILYDTETQKATYFYTNVPAQHVGAAVIGDYLHVYGGGFALHGNIGDVGSMRGAGNMGGVSHYRIHLSELINQSN